jgi:hypothetical protein
MEKAPPPEELVPDEKAKLHAFRKAIPETHIPEIIEDFLDWHRANSVWRADYQAELRRWMTRWKIKNPTARGTSKPGPYKPGNNYNWRRHYEKNRPISQRKLSAAERAIELEREYYRLRGEPDPYPRAERELFDITPESLRIN